MPKVPQLQVQTRRQTGGLGAAVDPGEARQWGEGLAKLGEAGFRVGAALAKADKANKATANSLFVAMAEREKKRRTQDIMNNFESLATSREQYTKDVRKVIDQEDAVIYKELEAMFGTVDPVTKQAAQTKLVGISSSFENEISARGVALETQYLKSSADQFISSQITDVMNNPDGVAESLAAQEGFIVDLYDQLGIPPGDVRTENAIRGYAKQTYVTALEGFMSKNRYRDAQEFLFKNDHTKVLSPEEAQSFTDLIRKRRDHYENRTYTEGERAYKLGERRKEEDYQEIMLDLYTQIDQARKEEDFTAIADLAQKADELASGGGLGINNRNLVVKKSKELLEKESTQTGYNDIAIKFFDFTTEKDLIGLRTHVIEMERVEKLTDEDAQSWLRLIQQKIDTVKSDPNKEKWVQANRDFLKKFAPNEQDLLVALDKKFGGNPYEEGYLALKMSHAQPMLAFERRIRVEGLSPDEALALTIPETVPSDTAVRPPMFKNRKAPTNPDEWNEDFEHYRVQTIQQKRLGTYSEQADIQARADLARQRKRIEADSELEPIRERLREAEKNRSEIEKAVQETTVLDKLLNNLGPNLPLPNITPQNIPYRR
jgi:hypothetical protein